LYYKQTAKKAIMLYIGANPGWHLDVLTAMFPDIEYHLYDIFEEKCEKFLSKFPQVKIYNKYFEENDIKLWADMAKTCDVFLVVDIRNTSYSHDKEKIEREKMIDDDMQLQLSWVQAINPKKSILKFKLPYVNEFTGKPLLASHEQGRKYLDGMVFHQAFSRLGSETRLVPFDNTSMKLWDCQQYNSLLFYHNRIVRERKYFLNPLTKNAQPVSEHLTLSYDSSLFTQIVIDYLMKVDVNPDQKNVAKIIDYIIQKYNLHTVKKFKLMH
jgi:hypothetical protein